MNIRNILPRFLVIAALAALSPWSVAQVVAQNRISQAVDSTSTFTLPGSMNPRARAQYDMGRAAANTQLTGVTIYFKLSAVQQAALDALVKAQQTPGSPQYRQWISTAQYAARFGVTPSDLEQVQRWLEQQGLSVTGVSNSRTSISFSGDVAHIEAAFHTEMHHYNIAGTTHIANATAISIPAAFSDLVLTVRDLSDFRPRPMHSIQDAVRPQFTAGSNHFLAPNDLATIYDIQSLYNAGYTGSGVTIGVVGQSAILASDIENFQKAAGLTQKAPTMTLVPNTGSSVVNDSTGDEDESDLDVEWSGAVARGATINFIYTGNASNNGVLDSLFYAIENNLAPVLSMSYGTCEPGLAAGEAAAIQSALEQANAQGQTLIAAAGDDGATGCESATNPDTIVNGDEATEGLAVSLPASSPFATAIGGTEFNGDVSSASTYWNGSNGSGGGSAIQYIPETTWNDTSTSVGISSGSGGVSILFGKPSWQAGNGVPNDGARDVPDISLDASPQHDGYLVCASGVDASSCSNGFNNSQNSPDIFGGTSFGAPTFAGIVAILNQKLAANGLGNLNPEIYALAAGSSGVFHDITTGNNESPCAIGSIDCTTSPIGYTANAGYDLATGWGSIDANNFVAAFSNSYAMAPIATTVALTSSAAAYTVNTAVTFTATVAGDATGAVPTGSVQFAVDGTNSGSAVSLSGGAATFAFTPTASGTHTITATYAGSSGFAGSSASLAIVVASPAGTGSFSLAATNLTVAPGASGNSTVTVTPSSGFTGTVSFTVSGPSALANACSSISNVNVTGTAPVTATLTIFTSANDCTGAAARHLAAAATAAPLPPAHPPLLAVAGTTLASLFLLGFSGLRRRRWPILLVLLGALPLVLSGCSSNGGSSMTSTSANAPAGTYTITVTGTNSGQTLTESTTFTLTIN